ncbi:MAG: hypothetical protein GY835_05610 [bacterium]|nr:hypothetical protein [bacterium]
MTDRDWCAYTAGASVVVQNHLDGQISWKQAVENLNELDKMFNRQGVGRVRFIGNREHDRRSAQAELDYRRKRDVEMLGCRRCNQSEAVADQLELSGAR